MAEVDGLLVQGIIVLSGTAEFMYKWSSCLKDVECILIKVLTRYRSRRIFERIAPCLHLLTPVLPEQSL